MTSGRQPCTDCGRNSPQGRHASCHILALLRDANGDRYWSKADLLRAVYPHRWAQRVPGEWPNLTPVDGAVSTLRKNGHDIVCWQGMVKLRAPRPLRRQALIGAATTTPPREVNDQDTTRDGSGAGDPDSPRRCPAPATDDEKRA